MSCASSIAVSLSRKQSFPVLTLRTKSLKHPMAIPYRPEVHWPSDFHRRAFRNPLVSMLLDLGQWNDEAAHFGGAGIFNQHAQRGGARLGLHVFVKKQAGL